jgi:hypothetical protein
LKIFYKFLEINLGKVKSQYDDSFSLKKDFKFYWNDDFESSFLYYHNEESNNSFKGHFNKNYVKKINKKRMMKL